MINFINKITKGEFSKGLTVSILVVYAFLVFAMVVLMAFVNPDLGTNFIGILGVVSTIPITAVGFFLNKAKGENLLKISNANSIATESNETQG